MPEYMYYRNSFHIFVQLNVAVIYITRGLEKLKLYGFGLIKKQRHTSVILSSTISSVIVYLMTLRVQFASTGIIFGIHKKGMD